MNFITKIIRFLSGEDLSAQAEEYNLRKKTFVENLTPYQQEINKKFKGASTTEVILTLAQQIKDLEDRLPK
jgi:hypothetical protein